MKILLKSFVLLPVVYQVNAATNNCTLSSWVIGGSISLDTTTCNLKTVTDAIGADCLNTLYGAVKVATAVQKLCASMEDPFGSVTNTPIDYHFDKNMMDGGTLWNYGNQNKMDEVITTIGGQVGRYLATRANKARIAWPQYASVSDSGFDPTGYMSNFHLNTSCALRAAMCCFTGTLSSSQLITKNADACALDLSASKNSNHVRRGSTRYDTPGKDAYCVGFSWSSDPTSTSFKYKGNALFAASLAQSYTSGYVGNLPGAPLCGCVEQMPTVTASACVSVDSAVETAVNFIFKGTNSTTNGGTPLVAKLSTSVTYGNCGGKDLKGQYATMSTSAEQAALAKRIVSDCNNSTAQLMSNQFLVPGSKTFPVDLSKWTIVAGQGTMYYPMIGEDAFRDLMKLRPDGRYPLVYRHCSACNWNREMKNIYYRRAPNKPYPLTSDFLNLFMSNWTSDNNLLGVHFNLYGSYADALNQSSAWQYCNYDDPSGTVGFPRDCGITSATGGYWTTYAVNNQNDNTRLGHAYFVEKYLG